MQTPNGRLGRLEMGLKTIIQKVAALLNVRVQCHVPYFRSPIQQERKQCGRLFFRQALELGELGQLFEPRHTVLIRVAVENFGGQYVLECC